MSEQNFGAGPGSSAFQRNNIPSEATDYIIEVEEDETSPNQADSSYRPGQEFADHRLIRLAARERLAELWEAYDSNLDCARALKIIRPELMNDPQAVEQFFQQARAQARLQHPNILQVQRVGRYGPAEIPFFVAEWVDGETLEERLARDGVLPPVAAWDLLRQIVTGLGYALEQGMIHRDLNPGNILLENPIRDSGDRRLRARVKDFGLSTILDTPGHGKAAVLPGSRPEYTAPEIVTGMEVDHRSDIYSLGILLYHMLTGFPPFQGSKRGEVLFKQVHDPLPALPPLVREAIGPEGMAVLVRMTQKRPDLRFSAYDELLRAIQTSPIMTERRKTGATPSPDTLLEGAATTPAPASSRPAAQTPPPSSSSRKFLVPALAALVVVGAGAALLPKLRQAAPSNHEQRALANAPAPDASGAQQLTAPAPKAEEQPTPAVQPAPETPAPAPSPAAAAAPASPAAAAAASTAAPASPEAPIPAPPAGPPPALTSIASAAASPTPANGTAVWSTLVSTTPAPAPGEVIVDNATPGSLQLTPNSPGTWRLSSLPGAYAYSSLLGTADGTEKTATFLADIPQSGEYQVFLWWVSGGERTRSSSVVCTVHTAKGPFKGVIDQTGTPNSGSFFPVGTYELTAGKAQPIVTISTEGVEPSPDRMVSVDALKLVFKRGGKEAGDGPSAGSTAVDPSTLKLPAGSIVVESGKGGKNHEQYKEVAGRWLDSKAPANAAKSTAYGLTPIEECPGRKFVFSVVGTDDAVKENAEARFYPELELPAHFHVYVTWPHGGNITPLNYVVHHANGVSTRTLTQDGYGPGPGSPNNANVWIRLGDFDFKPGKNNYISMVISPGARPVHTTANGQAYADAVCFSPIPLPDAQEDDQTTTRSIMPIAPDSQFHPAH